LVQSQISTLLIYVKVSSFYQEVFAKVPQLQQKRLSIKMEDPRPRPTLGSAGGGSLASEEASPLL